jgi:tape measure domain-containing protein
VTNEADFIVKLIDRITGPALRAAASLNKINRAARVASFAVNNVGGSLMKVAGLAARAMNKFAAVMGAKVIDLNLDGMFSAALRKMSGNSVFGSMSRGFLNIGQSADTAAGKISKIKTALRRTSMLYKVLKGQANSWNAVGIFGALRMRSALDAAGGAALNLGKRLMGLAKSGVTVALKSVASAAMGLASSLVSATLMAIPMAAAIAGIGVAVGSLYMVKKTVEMESFAQRTRAAFGVLEKSTERGNNAFAHAVELSRDLGTGVRDTVEGMLQLSRSGFSIGEGKNIISLLADMQAVGATAEQTKRAVLAITQIKSKRQLMSEELRGQLAETGVDVGLVKEKIAQLTGKKFSDVEGMMQKGQVTGDLGIEAISMAIKEKVGVQNAGDAARKISNTTLPGLLNQLKDMPDRFFLKVSNMLVGKDEMLDSIKQVITAVESIDSKGVADFVGNLISGISGAAQISIEFFKGFMSEISRITGAMEFGKPAADTLKSAAENGKLFATTIVGAIRLAKRGLEGIGYLLDKFRAYGGFPQLTKDVMEAWTWMKGIWTTVDGVAQALGGWKNVLIGVMVLKFLAPFVTLGLTIAFAVWKVKQLAKTLVAISLMKFPGLEAAIAGGGLKGAMAQKVKGGQAVAGKAGELLGKAPSVAGKAAKVGGKAIGKSLLMGIPGMAAMGRMMSGAGGLAGKAGGALMKIPGVGKLAGMGAGKLAGGIAGRAAGMAIPGLNIAMAAWTIYDLADAFGITDMAKQAWQTQFGGQPVAAGGAPGQAKGGKSVNMKVDMPITVQGGSSGNPADDRRLAELIGSEVNKKWLTFADGQMSEAVP